MPLLRIAACHECTSILVADESPMHNWGISAALAPICVADPARAQKVALQTGIEAFWKGTTSVLLGPSTSSASPGPAKTKGRRAPPKKASARRKKLVRKRAVARRKKLERRMRTAARRKAEQRDKRFKENHHIRSGKALSVPLPQQNLLAGASSQTNTQSDISQPSIDRTLPTKQTAVGKKRTDQRPAHSDDFPQFGGVIRPPAVFPNLAPRVHCGFPL